MDNLLQYTYSAWQQIYAKHTFKSVTIDLPEHFVEFLQEGGIVVSSCSKALPQRANPTEVVVEDVDYDPDDTYSSDDEASISDDVIDSSSTAKPWCEMFPEVYAETDSCIEQLGGQVAPKLSWSSPTDALWISTYNNLKCCNADQVFLLLKSSDRIMHDLELLHAAELQRTDIQQQLQQSQQKQQQPHNSTKQQDEPTAQHCQQQHQQQPKPAATHDGPPTTAAADSSRAVPTPQLVLRQWHDLLPECEFRCFIHHHQLVAISQRDTSQHFPQLAEQQRQQQIISKIKSFHQQCIADSFTEHDYALDVYVAASSSSSVKILDFNPICATTSSLLFSWEELPYTYMRSDKSTTQTEQQEKGHLQQQQQQQQSGPPAAGQHGDSHCHQVVKDVELRVVSQVGMIFPGARAATGMPVDMLGLQDSFEEVLRVMQEQQKQHQRLL